MSDQQKSAEQQIREVYAELVRSKYPELVDAWPIVSGFNAKVGHINDWGVVIYSNSGMSGTTFISGIGNLPRAVTGVDQMTLENRGAVRARLEKHFSLKPSDGIVFIDASHSINDELSLLLQKHEFSMGLIPMKIFLSHKGADKPVVREFKKTLELLGFDPWLDEDAMNAGTELERALLKGFDDSCAAIFFVTPNYKDENYLASEVDYAIAEKRKKGDRFSIITLVLGEGAGKGVVPELLHRYVWKEPKDNLEALREVLKALPVQVGGVYWKKE